MHLILRSEKPEKSNIEKIHEKIETWLPFTVLNEIPVVSNQMPYMPYMRGGNGLSGLVEMNYRDQF